MQTNSTVRFTTETEAITYVFESIAASGWQIAA